MTFSVGTKEWRWVMTWAGIIMLLSAMPYIIALLLTPDGWQFGGILVNPMDGQSYLAKMQQGEAGRWLFQVTYTPEPHAGSVIYIFYLALGHLVSVSGLPKILIFHGARLVIGFGLLLMIYRFVARITPQVAERRLAFILMACTAGVGWLGAALGAFPIDLWVPEAFVFYSLYTNPHFPLTMILMLFIFDQLLQVTDANWVSSRAAVLWSGLAALLLALLSPFALVTVSAVLVVFLSWSYLTTRRLPWSQLWLTVGVALGSTPVMLYLYWVSTVNPVLAGWKAQNLTPAPSPFNIALGYGLVTLLAIAGSGRIMGWDRKKSTSGEWLVLLWAVTTIVLVYTPFDLQRRLIYGLHIPLCILAAMGLLRWLAVSKLKAKMQRLCTLGMIAVGVLGALFVWVLPLLGTLQPPAEPALTALFFIRDEELAAFTWLRDNLEADDVILASPRVSLFIPTQTQSRVFYGHPFETVKAKTRKAQAEAFYRGEIQRLDPPPDYIMYGPSEQRLGPADHLSPLPIVYAADGIIIYQNQ